MNIDLIDKLLVTFYDGTIDQSNLNRLFDCFVHDSEVRRQRPDDAAVLIPLALARKDSKSRTRRSFSSLHTLRVAVVVSIVVLLLGIIATLELGQPTRVYTTDANCNYVCAEQWLNRTIRTAL